MVIDLDPGIARAVDAGLLAARLPRPTAADLRQMLRPNVEMRAS
jgi:hypothetical protein